MRVVALAVGVVALLPACGGDNVSAPPTISAPGPDTTTSVPASIPPASPPTTAALGPEDLCSTVSGPARFDAKAGTYSVYLTGINMAKRTVSFNVIQFLMGEDAIDAYHEENPSDPNGPPNDYLIVDDGTTTRTAPAATDVVVRLVRLAEDGDPDLDPGTFGELPTYLADYHADGSKNLSYNPFWLTFDTGEVTQICEQFVP
jgi:hypothetical protein